MLKKFNHVVSAWLYWLTKVLKTLLFILLHPHNDRLIIIEITFFLIKEIFEVVSIYFNLICFSRYLGIKILDVSLEILRGIFFFLVEKNTHIHRGEGKRLKYKGTLQLHLKVMITFKGRWILRGIWFIGTNIAIFIL